MTRTALLPAPRADSRPSAPSLPTQAAAALLGLVLTAAAAAITLDGGGTPLAAVARASTVAMPVAVGLYASRSHPTARFGRMLVLAGFAWFFTTLAESQSEVLYSTGRVAGWIAEPLLLYLIVTFPSGRLSDRVDRALVAAAALLVLTVYVPAALLTESYPVPSPYTSCSTGCPDNAFSVLGSELAFVDSVLLPLRERLTVLLFLAVTIRLVFRIRSASALMRLMLDPVLIVAVVRSVALAAALILRRAYPESAALQPLVWLVALGLPLTALAFMAGLASWRLYAGTALEGLGAQVREGLDRDRLQAVLAKALGDPGLRVVEWSGATNESWLDGEGAEVAPPGPEDGHGLTELRDGGRRVAAIVHDAALDDKPEFLAAVASYASIALQNRRLALEVEESLHEVEESRARLLASADAERRKIERDLHDGAQQRLVALRIQLELAEDLIAQDPEEGMAKVHELGGEVDATLDEIRTLARGVYPSLLADRGLAEALPAAGLRVPLSVSVDPNGIGRYPQDIEAAVYFCCLEAMQNASKHAHGATSIAVALKQDDALRFQVRDDGAGFDAMVPPAGEGLTNMRDRIVAVGGQLSIRSSSGGTVVTGSVPLRALARSTT